MGGLALATLCMSLLLSTSCVVPIPASPEESDAGTRNDTPTIQKSSPIDFPGPVQLPGTPTLTLTLIDGDVSDTLYVRVYKNYGPGSQSRGLSEVMIQNDPVGGREERTTALQTSQWCVGSAGMNVAIDVVVADEPFDDTTPGEFAYKVPKNNGRWSERNYVVACNQPQ